MKKSTIIFLFTFLQVLANPQQVILRSVMEGKEFTVPRKSLRYAHALYTAFNPPEELAKEKITEVSMRLIDALSLSFVATLLNAVDKHENVTGKNLLDALEGSIALPSYEKKIELLRVADFLGFELMQQLIIRSLAKGIPVGKSDTILEALSDRKTRQQLARYYYLLHGKNLAPNEICPDSYGFTVNELLEYRRIAGRLGNERRVYDLSHRRITDLAGLEKIENAHFAIGSLLLDGNKIKTIPEDVFKNFTNLRELELQDNHIDTIQRGALNGLGQLHALRLGKNKLEYITNDMFVPLKMIFILRLQQNDISEIAPDAFVHNEHLSFLDVSDNKQLKEIPVSGLVNTNLNVLNIRGTQIPEQYEKMLQEMFSEIAIDK